MRIHLSQEVFTPDTAVAQHWADFFASLVHGSELATLDAYLLSPSQISAICGRGALACYGGNRILTPVEDPAFDLSAESVAAHEYGPPCGRTSAEPASGTRSTTGRSAGHVPERVREDRARDVVPLGAEDGGPVLSSPG